MTCQELVDYLQETIAFAEEGEASFVMQSNNSSPEDEEMSKLVKKLEEYEPNVDE